MNVPLNCLGSASALDQELTELVERFAGRVQAGEKLDPLAYAAEYPEHELRLRQLLPAALLLANLGLSASRGDSAVTALASGLDYSTRTLGDFRIVREIGRGGMGVVYEAEQISLGRKVALKVLPFASVLDQRQLQRFKNEAQAAAVLKHPNIVGVHCVGCERGVHYFAMELVEGQSLAEVIAQLRKGKSPESRVEGPESRVERPESDGNDPVAARSPGHAAESGATAGLSSSARSDQASQDTLPIAALSTEGDTHSPGYFRTVARLGIQAAEALEYAHQLGIVHRDIKPSNLLVEEGKGVGSLLCAAPDGPSRQKTPDPFSRTSPHLWITDFGLAQVQSDNNLTMTGDLLGTLRYMSPEQASGRRAILDHRTDIYSLGITLYELATLQPAFGETDRAKLLRDILERDPRPPRSINPSVPRDLETIILKSTAKEPSARYDSAGDLADDLRRFLSQKPITARRTTRPERLWRWCRRNPVVATLTAAVLLLLCVLSVAGPVMTAHQASLKRDLAHQLSVSELNLALQAWFAGNVPRTRELVDRHRARTAHIDDSAHLFPWGFLERAIHDADDSIVWERPSAVNALKSVEISPDGKTLAITPLNSNVALLDLATGNQRQLNFVAFRVAMSPDGVLACCTEDGHVRFWDLAGGQFVDEYWHLNATPQNLVYTADGNHLIAGLKTGEIAVWPPGEVESFRAHDGPAKLPSSRDRVTLASLPSIHLEKGFDVSLWDLKTRERRTLGNPIRTPRCVEFSIDGKYLFVGSNEGVTYWDTQSWEEKRIVPTGVKSVQSIATTSDGMLITAGYDGLIRFWHVASGRQIHTLFGHDNVVWGIDVSKDETWLCSQGGDGTVRKWPLEEPLRVHRAWSTLDKRVHPSIAFNTDGKRLLAAIPPVDPAADGRLECWDVSSGALHYTRPVVLSGQQLISFAEESNRFATASRDAVAVWDADAIEPLYTIGSAPGCLYECVAYSDDGRWLAAVCQLSNAFAEPGLLVIWELTPAGQPTGTPHEFSLPLTTTESLTFSPDSQTLVVSGRIGDGPRKGGEVFLLSRMHDGWRHSDVPLLRVFYGMYGTAFSPDGSVLFSCEHSHAINRWDFHRQEALPAIRCPDSVQCVAVSPDGGTLASGHSGAVRLWDLTTGDDLGAIPVHIQVASLAFSPDGRTLAWGGWDGTVSFLHASVPPHD